MVEIYLGELSAVLELVPLGPDTREQIECKHFFSGAAAYCNGKIFMTMTPAGLALKLPEDDRLQLLQQGAKPLRYFAKAPIKKDYVVMPGNIARDNSLLAPWVQKSVSFCRGKS